MNRALFGLAAAFYAVGAGGALTAPETLIGPIPQLNFATTIDTGGFLQNSVAAGTILTDGAYFDGASWIAKDTGAVVLQMNGSLGGFIMYANSSLTPGVAFAPVTVLQYLGYGSPYEFDTPLKVVPPAFTGLTASTENNDVDFALNRTVQFGTGTLALQRAAIFRGPTYGFVGASTLTKAATLSIVGQPLAGTNATITASYVLDVQATAVATSELIAIFSVADDAVAKFEIFNSSSSNGVMVPCLRGTGSGSNQPLFIIGAATNDSVSSTQACIKFDGRIGISTSAATKNIVEFTNNNLQLAVLSAAGGLTISGGTAPGLTVGASGTKITQTKVYSQTITPASVAALTTVEQTFTVTGLTTADKVIINPGAAPTAGTGIVGVRVIAADTLAVTYINTTAGALTPVSSTCLIIATRS